MMEFFRLSTQQKHLWLLQQDGSSLPYRTQCTVLIEGILNIEALEIALNTVINRHEILRTTFKSSPGEIIPFQVITDSNLPPIYQHDLATLTPLEQEAEIAAILQKMSQLDFDFAQAPILNVSLIILSPQKHLLLLCLPSLCADGVTLKNLVHEISYNYGGLPKKQLQQEAMQYADYSEWQHELLIAEDTKEGRKYWEKQDISAIFNFKLPGENQSAKSREFQPESIAIAIDPHTVAKLKNLIRQYDISISVFLQTIWHIHLWRLTGESNLIVGVAYDGRQYEELQPSLGLFARYLPIHANLAANLQFLEVLKQINESTRQQTKWQDYFSWNEINLSWFPVSYNFVEETEQYFADNLVIYIDKQLTYIDQFKLNLSCCVNKNQEIVAEFHYDSNLFRAEDIKRWAGQFQMLLASAIENPLTLISKLEILSEVERQQLLLWCNNTETNYSKFQCIHQLFEKQADSTPDNVAVVFENQQLTYAQLNARANQLARYLQDLGVGPEVLVAICLERSHLIIIALLAILKAGGAYVPLDPQLPKERQVLILEDTQATVVLTQEFSAWNLPEHRARVVSLDADWHIIAEKSNENLFSLVTPENLIYVLYTSGSTGKPKGVAVEHQQMCNYLYSILAQLNLPNGASFSLVSSFAADLGNTVIFPALCTGGCLHVISPERASDADKLADYYYNHGGIDCLKIVPSHLQALLNSCRHPAQILPRHQLVLGGEALSWQLVEKVQALAPDCKILNHYGPTEATVGVLTYQVENGQSDYAVNVPLGQPLANTQILLLDEHLQPVPIGIPGEVYIGGANLARGYFNRPDLTKEKFIPNPFDDSAAYTLRDASLRASPRTPTEKQATHSVLQRASAGGDRLYKTGDLARYLSDGNIEFLGRIDHQVKIRGFRIELGELEAALRQHPAVQESVAIALDDDRGEKRLVAYIVPHRTDVSSSELRNFLQEKLPDYMMPSVFVRVDALPLLLNGKLDRRSLPAPDWTRPELEAAFIAPRTPEEQILADIWAEVLGVERVGVQDNFFELGGDSILSIQIVARAKEAGLCLTPMQLFHHQTIAQLIAVATKILELQIEQGLVAGEVPLTPIQHWLFEQNLPEPHHWNMSILLETPPNVNPNWLEQVIQHLNQHHDALRLRFERVGASWQQIYTSNNIPPLSRIDLANLPAPEQASAIETEIATIQATLNLSTTLMRVALFNLGADQPGRLAIVIHHLVMDGISWRIWLEDFHRAYQQLSKGTSIQLAAKTTSFKHWAERLHLYAQSTALQQEFDYWLNPSFHQVSRLPRDDFGQPNTVASARTVSVSLSAEDTQALLQEVPAVYKTQINDLLLTPLALAFRQWTGENTLLVELEGHGREALFNDVDVSRTIGWFTTHFPVLLDLSLYSGETEPFVENGKKSQATSLAVKSIKQQLRQIPHRGIGYGLLRYLSGNPEITKKLPALPEAEVSFNYLGRFDRSLPQSTLFQLVKESTGYERSLQGKRTNLIAIDAIVLEGKLQLNWTYSENVHKRATIEHLAENFHATLRGIIRHCLSVGGGYTPSDFPLAKLNQEQLDLLAAKFAIADIYCLSPLQQGLLFHSLYDPTSRMYFQQKIFTLQGKLNITAFQQAWQQVVNRHPSLRTIFIWEELAEPIQVVLERIEVPWQQQDWRYMSPTEQEQQLQAYLQADSQQRFSLSDGPLMRLALIQTATDIHQLVWSHHHILLDGWCNSIILTEVFNFYEAFCQGQDLYLEDSRLYRDYIVWLQQQDWSGEDSFWQQALRELPAATKLGVDWVSGSLPQQNWGYAQEEITLSSDVTSSLHSFARQHHLTLNTIIQGVWALLLSRYSGEEDVVFGVTVSGRPADLPGVEAIVGLLINTLPMRVRVPPHVSLLSWLQHLQQQHVEMLQYQYSSLVQIQGWSQIPRGTPLFDSFVNFQNYPLDISLREQSRSLKIINVRCFFETNYPLSLTVEPGSKLLIRINYLPNQFNTATIRRILEQFGTVLKNIPVNLAYPLSHISLTTETTTGESQELVNSFNADLE
ncbi:non-ribosomal peptide synthetase [Nostoc sp. UHCC 0251]|uniref:non-ribosomal peptide synthetase n=1 Tax=Nostoc sp. UHCC 0251 TaxID=3110240 RepID=UPI002B20D623|nr:non-ribosomal peptide synthetase [Nostoc sp. UHCC 0251]MEA5622684.1 amino acid adenylation domain-containing protein [Nostoc sp. UHCC 0251]